MGEEIRKLRSYEKRDELEGIGDKRMLEKEKI